MAEFYRVQVIQFLLEGAGMGLQGLRGRTFLTGLSGLSWSGSIHVGVSQIIGTFIGVPNNKDCCIGVLY